MLIHMLFKFCIYSKKNRTGQERSLNSFASKKKKILKVTFTSSVQKIL